MEYRPFGQLPFKVSALGFGCMRLPTRGSYDAVDEPATVEMLRYAVDQGVNYIDTAYPYHGGNSERAVGRALEGGYRERVALATKMPIWAVKGPEDFDRLFAEQLERLRTPRIDFYLLHNLQAGSWERMRGLGVIPWMEKARADGRIGQVGFSFHDTYDAFRGIVDGYGGWTFCQIQYNYVNEDVQAGTRGLQYAAARGLAVVVMEPLHGGTLAQPPEPVRQLWQEAGRDPVATALRWLWDKPEVSVVLSGMSTLDQVRENVRSASASGVGTMTAEDKGLVARAAAAYRELHAVPCTKCGYCLPCPHGVAIPENFEIYNGARTFGGNVLALNRNLYGQMPPARRADACKACRECEAKCPQHIKIRDWLAMVHEEMTNR